MEMLCGNRMELADRDSYSVNRGGVIPAFPSRFYGEMSSERFARRNGYREPMEPPVSKLRKGSYFLKLHRLAEKTQTAVHPGIEGVSSAGVHEPGRPYAVIHGRD